MQKRNHQNLNKVKIMSKNTENKEDKGWELSLGFYPGILFGARTYDNHAYIEYVFYLPFVDVSLIVDK